MPTPTARERSTLASRLAHHFTMGAALAAGAALSAAGAAGAAVIYTPVNWIVPSNLDGIYIDVDLNDFSSASADVPGWDINPYSPTSLTWFTAPGAGLMRFPGVVSGSAGSLAVGTQVGPTASYGSGVVVVGTAPGTWRLNDSNYFGFRFIASDGAIHYGWGRFDIGASISGGDRRISEIAWETVANRPIVVGDMGGSSAGYNPCSGTNPVASVGANQLALNQTSAANLSIASCGMTITKANYFKFVAPAGGQYIVGTCGTSADTRIAVLDGCGSGAAVLSCDDNACAPGSQVAFDAVANSVYYIVVGGAGADLPSPISLSIDPPWPTCAAPAAAVVGVNPFSCATYAGEQVVSSVHKGTVVRTIYNTTWFEFIPTSNGIHSFSLCGAAGDTQIAIASSCAASPTSVLATLAYDDDGCPCATGHCAGLAAASAIDGTAATDKPLVQPLVAGTPYLVVVGGFGANDAPFGTLTIEAPSTVYNPCSAFNPIAVEGSNTLPIVQELVADRDLGACGVVHRANYFKFVPAFSGGYTVATCGAAVDTALAVLDGCGPGAHAVACAKDNCGTQESIVFTATAGTPYYIVVGAGTAATTLPATVSVKVTAPFDPACAGSARLDFGSQPFDNRTSSVIREAKCSLLGDLATVHHAVFYDFTPAVTGAYRFGICSGTGDSLMALATTCPNPGVRFDSIAFNDESCGSLSVIDATNGGAAGTALGGFPLTQNLNAGQTYHLLVGSYFPNEAVIGTLVVSGPPQGSPADLNHDGVVNASDLALLLSNWSGQGVGDIDQDGVVGASDLAVLLSSWG